VAKAKARPKRKRAAKPKPKQKRAAKPKGADELLWAIIDRVRKRAKGDLQRSCDAFRAELEALGDRQLRAVEAAFSEKMQRAYHNRLWHAAYVIHGGCGDDAFWDFRAGLVALGKKVYEAALKHPDSLSAVDDLENLTLFEGFQYIPDQLLEARGLTKAGGGHSRGEPTGEPWDDSDESHRKAFPKLFAKYW
jgi:hypothetical protein